MQLQQGPTFPVTQKPPNFKTFSRKNGYELGARIEAGFLTKCEVYVAVLTFKKYEELKVANFSRMPPSVNCALVVRAIGAMLQMEKKNGALDVQWKVLASPR